MLRSLYTRVQVLAGVAVLSAASLVPAQENLSQWTGLRAYSLNTSASGANVAGTVTNFPVLVRLGAADSAVFAAAKTDGADLRFSKANGARLSHQIEFWNAASRTAAIWVKADTVLGATAMQVVRMHWGKADAADSSRGAAVFATGNGFVGVWHMEGAANVADATGSGLAAVGPGGGTPGASPAGNIGPARSFDGSTQYFTVANDARLNVTAALTMSLWVNATNWAGSTRLLQKSDPAENNAGQYGLRDDSNNKMAMNINGIHTNSGLGDSPSTGEWHLIHGTFDGSTTIQYQDGVAVASGSVAGPIANGTGELTIARRPDGTGYLTGVLDEVRISGVVRGADWVRLEYENQKASQTLLQLASSVSIRSDAGGEKSGEGSAWVRSSASGLAFTLPAGAGTAQLTVVDMKGRAVWSHEANLGASGTTLSHAGLRAGSYIARMTLHENGAAARTVQQKISIAR
jgi:hypothetical protein